MTTYVGKAYLYVLKIVYSLAKGPSGSRLQLVKPIGKSYTVNSKKWKHLIKKILAYSGCALATARKKWDFLFRRFLLFYYGFFPHDITGIMVQIPFIYCQHIWYPLLNCFLWICSANLAYNPTCQMTHDMNVLLFQNRSTHKYTYCAIADYGLLFLLCGFSAYVPSGRW